MGAFTLVRDGVWRWDGTDADRGFPITGYVIATPEGLALVDPPGTSGSAEEIRALGKPVAVVITGLWHVRGGPRWAQEFSIPLFAPANASSELVEAGGKADYYIKDGDTSAGWQALQIRVGEGDNVFDEFALWEQKSRTLVLGDLLVGSDNDAVALGPVVFYKMTVEQLRPALQKLITLQPQLILSAHVGPQENATDLLSSLI